MDAWPTDARETDGGAVTRQAKYKGKGKAHDLYPVVQQGSLTAANLYWKGDRLDWTFLAQENEGPRLVPRGAPVKISPATRPRAIQPWAVSITQQVEQGAHFLRTFYPDVEIASELIRDELAEDARLSQQTKDFDPYAANLLSPVFHPDTSRRKLAYIAFPLGETNCDLNLSPFAFTKRDGVTFRPRATAAWSFETPIEQIVASPFADDERKQRAGALLAVRTYTSTSLLEVGPKSAASREMQTNLLTEVMRSDLNDRPAMDAIFPYPSSANIVVLFVNDCGAVYKCTLPHGEKFFQHMNPQQSPSSPNAESWRLARTNDEDSCLLLSSSNLHLLDFRGSKLDLYTRRSPGELLTSVEGPQDDHMIRLSTTSEVLWIDERYIKKPVIAVRHGREFDRSLQVQSMTFSQNQLTFLTSHRNGLVSIYDISRGEDGLVHSNIPSYALPTIPIVGSRRVGHALFRHPAASAADDQDVSILQLSDRGSLHRLDLTFSPTGEPQPPYAITHEWSPEIENIDRGEASGRQSPGSLGGRNFSEVNMEPGYQRLFFSGDALSENPEEVYDLLDLMPAFWQKMDEPGEQIFTLFDVAFRSGSEPSDTSRADFFTGSALSSIRGFRALSQGRIPGHVVAKQAAWHENIMSFLQRFITEIDGDAEEMVKKLRTHDLASNGERTAASLRRESEACEQLAVDLALSADILSSQPFRKASSDSTLDDAFETMSRAAEAMSITDSEPPEVQFGYLHPTPKEVVDHYANLKDVSATQPKSWKSPLGVRLLLQEWDIGADPLSYAYQDPYDSSPQHIPPRRVREPAPLRAQVSMNDAITQSQKPPAVVAAAPMAPPAIATRPPIHSQAPLPAVHSHNTGLGTQPRREMEPSSKDVMMSTQVLPGPHGGRPLTAKKKPAKKRMGGF